MTILGVDAAAVPASRQRTDAGRAGQRPRSRGWLRPGWPLALVFTAYPLWWLLGIAPVVCLLACVVMGYHLAHRRRIVVPKNFGFWLLFLLWVAAGVFVLQVDAPGAVPGASNARYLTWAYRLSWYLGSTVVLLYIVNLRRELPVERVNRTLAWMFVTVVAGGLLGTVIPQVQFPSLLELVLPHSLSSNGFVMAQIHPTLAQWGDVLGHEAGRPSAPFTYANIWGLNFACLLPFFVASWLRPGAGWRRLAGPIVLVAAVVPVVYSLNRGLWLALLVSAVFVAARSAMSGRFRLLALLVLAGVAVGAVVMFSPLSSTIDARFSSSNSNEGRTNLGTLALQSTAQKSPVVGFGTTRNVQGSFASITGGDTAQCPRCSPPALGTQGQFSLVVFSQGFVGVLLYVGFFVLLLLRHIRVRSAAATMALTVVLVQLVTMPVYNTIGPALFVIMAAVAILCRESQEAGSAPASLAGHPNSVPQPTVGAYLGLVRRHCALVVCFALAGTVGGSVWQYTRGGTSIATASVLLPEEQTLPGTEVGPLSLDTQGQLVSTGKVQAAVSAITGRLDNDLRVSATPNSRVLNISYADPSAATAEKVVTIAADTVLSQREAELAGRRTASIARLRTEVGSLSDAMATLDGAENTLGAGKKKALHAAMYLLKDRRYKALMASGAAHADLERVSIMRTTPGHVVRPAAARVVRDGWSVAVLSGLLAGLVAGILAGLVMDARGRRARNQDRILAAAGVPVLASVPATALAPGQGSEVVAEVSRRLRLYRPEGFVSVSDSTTGCQLAAGLERASIAAGLRDEKTGETPSRRVILVVPDRARTPAVRLLCDRLTWSGTKVVGAVLVTTGRASRT